MLRMEWFVKNYLISSVSHSTGVTVLDVGSHDINGGYRTLFQDPRFIYKGLDIESGPNVDIVVKTPYHWSMLEDESFDVVISGQAFEHIEFFWLTFKEMSRILKPGGLVCLIAPRGFGRHRYPVDCYRFDTDGMVALAKYTNLKPLHASMNLAPVGASQEWYSINAEADAMLIAEKPVSWSGTIDPENYIFQQNDLESLATGFVEMPSVAAVPVQEDNTKVFSDKILAHDNSINEIKLILNTHAKTIEANQRWITRFRYSTPYRFARKIRSLIRK